MVPPVELPRMLQRRSAAAESKPAASEEAVAGAYRLEALALNGNPIEPSVG